MFALLLSSNRACSSETIFPPDSQPILNQDIKSRLSLPPPIFVCYNNLIPQPYRWCGSAGFSWVRPTCRVVYIDHQERWPPPLLLPQTDLRQLVRTLHLLIWYRIRPMFSPKPVLWCQNFDGSAQTVQCFNGRLVCEGEVTRVCVWEGVREGQLLVCYLTYLPALACRHICVLLPLATLIAWVGNLYLWTRSLFHRFYFADMRRHSWDAEGPDRPDVRGAPRRDLGGI